MTGGFGSAAPRVSAVIVNWNGEHDLRVALPSLLDQTYPQLEVLVVDNGSDDNSMNVAQRMGVRWIPLGRNYGLAGALNEGAAASEGEFLLFLNNDMRFAPDFVTQLVEVLSSTPDLFGVDAMQLDWEGKQIVHSRTSLRKAKWPSGEIPGWEFAQLPVREPTVCLMGSAANLLVRRDMFEELGGWDVDYPVGWEDVDLCWRASMRGWGICYVPTAVCWHRVGASMGSRAGERARMRGSLTGRLHFSTKLLPWRHVLGTWGLGFAGVFKAAAGGSYADALARASVIWRCAVAVPDDLRQRWRTYKEAGTTPGTHWRKMVGNSFVNAHQLALK